MRSSEVSVFDFVATALSARNHSVLPPLKYIVVYSAGCRDVKWAGYKWVARVQIDM
ncbi:hypothetical protein F2Q69_00048180, partial [Brassica cretica]